MTTTSRPRDAAVEGQLRAVVDGSGDELLERFERLRRASRALPVLTLEERQGALGALAGSVVAERERIRDAMDGDFGVHPEQVTYLTEVLGVAGQAMHVIDQLPAWMRADQRELDPALYGTAGAEIRYAPKGVVGIIAPWNFPFLLSLGPAIDALAAGNRVMIKPSEHAPASAELLRQIVATTFAEDLVTVVTGGVDTARRFAALPFDHLIYTGSTTVGREVAVAAARNLTPVTLELGGKNPVLVHEDAVTEASVRQIVGNKLVKSGQVCIAPDYVLIPAAQVDRFVEFARDYVEEVAPALSVSADCTGIIDGRHLQRIADLIDEARDRCEVVTLGAADAGHQDPRQLPLSLVLDPPDDLAVMREEIFGPVLPIVPYDTLESAIDRINRGERPLALYVFAEDATVADQVLARTTSGGACVNTCAIQGVLPSLGFGGAGASGHGRHRGIEGFRALSVERGVVTRGEGDLIEAFFPPYDGLAQSLVSAAFGGEA